MTGWGFYALGNAAPQGSKRHVGHGVMIESSKRVKPWRDTITAAAPPIERPLDGPLAAKLVFTLARPKSARKRDVAPCRTPDLDKCARLALDSCTAAGLWADDARVVEFTRLAKVWFGYDDDAIPVPGVVIAAVEIGPGYHHDLHRLYRNAQTAAAQRVRGVA